jgi:hypothetical protein
MLRSKNHGKSSVRDSIPLNDRLKLWDMVSNGEGTPKERKDNTNKSGCPDKMTQPHVRRSSIEDKIFGKER